jgi:REP element-mobilizing transposase RayT
MKTPFGPRAHRRRSIRLPGYDYTRAGAYFITLCTHHHEGLLGDIVNGIVRLNPMGEIALDEWARTEQMRPRVTIDAFVVMPDHLHGILVIEAGRSDTPPGADTTCGYRSRGTLQRAPT